VPEASLSVAIAYSVPGCSGTLYVGRSFVAADFGIVSKCCLTSASIAGLSKSPTATTAISSGRYQSS
jgi:hypothetical protein